MAYLIWLLILAGFGVAIWAVWEMRPQDTDEFQNEDHWFI